MADVSVRLGPPIGGDGVVDNLDLVHAALSKAISQNRAAVDGALDCHRDMLDDQSRRLRQMQASLDVVTARVQRLRDVVLWLMGCLAVLAALVAAINILAVR